MNDEFERVWKVIIEILFQNLLGGTEEDHDNLSYVRIYPHRESNRLHSKILVHDFTATLILPGFTVVRPSR
jgi:hypothetical protein